MLKNKLICFSILFVSVIQAANAAESSENPAQPISAYPPEIQQQATELMGKGWLVERRFNKVRNKLQRRQDLAGKCDDLTDPVGTGYDTVACKNYARSTRPANLEDYWQECARLTVWNEGKQAELLTNLGKNSEQTANFESATEVAVEQLEF